MLKKLLVICIATSVISESADVKKNHYITELEKQWLILVNENNYSTSDLAHDAITLKNQTKETMQKNGLSWADIDEIELTALKNAREKNKRNTKAKL